ncbi:MAG: substrate-binding domain-containing protein [Desulfuromonadales bacterium]|nr:substrate-binding domain-containing protein [Desulfuromonadales bacterium]
MTQCRSKLAAIFLFVATLVAILCVPMVFAAEHSELFNSPAFADPDETMSMPEDWKNKPVIGHVFKDEDADIYMTLSYQIYNYFAPIIQDFARKNDFTIDIKHGSCGTSTGALMRKEVDIASFCCSPSRVDHLPGVHFHALGIVPVVIVVNEDNPVDNLSLADLMKVFSGEIVNWSQLGGEDLLIQPVARLHCKTRPGRWRPLDTPDDLSTNVLLVGAISDNLDFIVRTPGGIGYESLPNLKHKDNHDRIKILNIDGLDPVDLVNLARGDYPYYRSYVFTTWEGGHLEKPLARKIIAFINAEIKSMGHTIGIIPAERLKVEGWRFHGDELVGEPE